MKKLIVLMLAIALIFALSAVTFSASDTFNITATVVDAISVSVDALDFGYITVDSEEVVTETETTNAKVEGTNDEDVIISIEDSTVTLEENDGDGELSVALSVSGDDTKTISDGEAIFTIQGTLTVLSDAATGGYTGSGQVNVKYTD